MLFPPGLISCLISCFCLSDLEKNWCYILLILPSPCVIRSWSLSVQREEQATCLYWAMSNTRLFVLQISRLCWRAVLDCFQRVKEACLVGWWMGSDVLLLIRTNILCESYGLWLCFVFRVAIKTIHQPNNINLFSYYSIAILMFGCCAKCTEKYYLK